MINNTVRAVFVCPLLTLTLLQAKAQNVTDAAFWLKQIKGFDVEKQFYDYKVTLVKSGTNQLLDSVSGRLYRNGELYLDSNRHFINMRDANYTLQINHRSKAAYLKSISAIELRKRQASAPSKPLGKLPFEGAGLPDKITVTEDENGNKHLSMHFKQAEIESLELTIDRDKNLKRLVMRSVPVKMTQGSAQQILTGENFSSDFDGHLLSTARFLNRDKQGIKMKGKYASYKTEEII